jgi:Raf kinase inhibitor-like YbhB/YbcL family protein
VFLSSFVALAVAASTLAACDTRDGTRLQTPTSPTTLPPPDTTPLDSVPLDGSDALPSLAPDLDTLPADSLPVDSSVAAFRVFAPWIDGGQVDADYTCDGGNLSPPLSWIGVPDDAVELAVSLVDESVLNNGRPFVHWAVAGIDPASGRLDTGAVPPGAVVALNFFGDVGYGGPCPPLGEEHSYRLTLYALGQQAEVTEGTPAAEFLDVIDAIAFDSTSTLGTSKR